MHRTRSTGALAILSIALVVVVSTPAHGKAKDGGAAVIAAEDNQPLRSGGSHTDWMLRLPSPPASNCSGDSAKDAHFVYTYLVAATMQPEAITFHPEFGVDAIPGQVALPLIDSFGKAYISRNTAPDTGQVLPGTSFTLDRLSIDGNAGAKVTPGPYNVGMACWDARNRTLDKYWNATLTVRESAGDPNGFVWTATPAAATQSDDESLPAWPFVAGAALALVVLIVVLRRRSISRAGVL